MLNTIYKLVEKQNTNTGCQKKNKVCIHAGYLNSSICHLSLLMMLDKLDEVRQELCLYCRRIVYNRRRHGNQLDMRSTLWLSGSTAAVRGRLRWNKLFRCKQGTYSCLHRRRCFLYCLHRG